MTGDVESLPVRIGRYEVLGIIGRGAFAEVVRAWDESLASYVAIKVLTESAAADPLVRQRFMEEGQILRRIHSDCVVAVHDLGELDSGRPYLVVDLASRGTLADRLDRRGDVPVDTATVIRIVDALAAGLAAIHAANVIHRDVKPENLLIRSPVGDESIGGTAMGSGVLGDDERLLIGDLGLAKDLAQRGSAPSVMGGSARYQAPEQTRPDGSVGPPADLYAASAVLWRLITGSAAPEPVDLDVELGRLRSGWQTFFAQAMAIDPARRFATAEAWRAAVLDHLSMEPAAVEQRLDVDASKSRACPYKGLAAFQPEDADVFFGREDLVDDLVLRLHAHRMLVVAGPSGSGKSSVVRAGFIPALREGALPGSDEWRYDFFTPGSRPLDELRYRLTRGAADVSVLHTGDLRADPSLARRLLDLSGDDRPRLLFVDQFEELFTHTDDLVERTAFIDSLAAVVDPIDSQVRVVLGVRADFYDRCAQYDWLARRISESQVLVGPMSPENMRRAIEGPARRIGLRFENGLVDAMLAEAGHSASSLPLISHALVETWARRDGNMLTLAGFRDAGGVAGAIAQSADALFDGELDDRQRAAARRLLLRLVTPGEGTADTRRRLPQVELERDNEPDVMGTVVDAFVNARLLTVDDSSVEIVHEALIRSWPRLRDWIDVERENLRFRHRITRASMEWEASGRDPDLLYRGAPLATALERANEQPHILDRLEWEFLDESESLRQQTEATQRRSVERAHRNRRRATVALALLAVASIVASAVAFGAFRRASSTADVAERQFANALGTSALGRAESDPAQAILLAVESMERSDGPTVDARSALVQSRVALAGLGVVPLGSSVSTPGSFRVALRPDGAVAAVADQTGPIRLYDTASGDQLGEDLIRHTGGARALVFTPDGQRLLSGGSDGLALSWNLQDPVAVPEPDVLESSEMTVWAIDVHPAGETVAIGRDDGTLRFVDLASGDEIGMTEWSDGGGIIAVAFSPDGQRLIAANRDGRLQSWSPETGAALWPTDATPAGPNIWEIAFSPDGSRFATVGDAATAEVHDATNGAVVEAGFVGESGGPEAEVAQIRGVAFSPDGDRLIGGSASGAVHTWDVDDPSVGRTTTTARHGDAVEHGALSADGSIYVTVGDDKQLRVWRARPVPASTGFSGLEAGAFGIAFDPRGDRIAVGDGAGAVHLLDLDEATDGTGGDLASPTETSPAATEHDGRVFDLAWSPDGSVLVSFGDDGRIVAWDPESLTPTGVIGQHDGAGRTLAFSPDGRRLVSGDQGDEQGLGASAVVWDAGTWSKVGELAGHDQGIRASAFSADGRLLATADGRGEIRLWDADDLSLVRQWRANEQINPVWALSFNEQGLLASVDSSEDFRVWDPETGQPAAATVSGLGTNGATGVAFTDDGATAAVLTRGGDLHLIAWAAGSSLTHTPIRAHPGADAFRLRVAPDGVRIATSGTDGSVRIWDVLSPDAGCAAAGTRLDMDTEAGLLEGSEAIGCD